MAEPIHDLAEVADDDAEFVQLYAKLAQALAVSGVVGQNPSALLSIQIPGVVISPGLNPDDPETQYYVSNLLNAALECNYVVTRKAGLASDVYKLILDGKETPLIELTPEQREALRKAEHYLYEPGGEMSPAFRAYLQTSELFYAAQDALFAAEATQANGGADVPIAVRESYALAKEAWLVEGHKDEVDAALATIRQLQPRDPYVFWQRLADRFAESTGRLENGSEFQFIDSIPHYHEWFKDELWTPFSFDQNDYRRQRRSGGTGMRGQSRCCCAPERVEPQSDGSPSAREWHDERWSLAASAGPGGADEAGPKALVAAGHLSFRCSIKRVNIVRPWMDVTIFSSRMWKWSPQSIERGIVVSSGGSVAGNRIATGVLPVLPTTAILSKDVELTMTRGGVFDWIDSKLRAGHRVRFGPFHLTSLRRPTATEARAQPSSVGVALGSPELFGYISTIFGVCPNPDMTLRWPS